MELLVAFAPFVPLGQTILWTLLIVGLVLWFNIPLRQILDAIRKRVEAGNGVKAGWFELSELKPLSPEQQRQKTKEEVADATLAGKLIDSKTPGQNDFTAVHLQSEDLALRAIQTEFDAPLVRQIEGSGGANFDAAFYKHNRLHVVEVKTYNRQVGFERLRSSIAKIASATVAMGGTKARLIVAVVYSGTESPSEVKAKVREALANLALEIDVRVYSLEYLKSEFGSSDA